MSMAAEESTSPKEGVPVKVKLTRGMHPVVRRNEQGKLIVVHPGGSSLKIGDEVLTLNGSEEAVLGLLERRTLKVFRYDMVTGEKKHLTVELPRGGGHELEVETRAVEGMDGQPLHEVVKVLRPVGELEAGDVILRVNGSIHAKEALLDERTLEVIRMVVSGEEGDDATSAPLVVPKIEVVTLTRGMHPVVRRNKQGELIVVHPGGSSLNIGDEVLTLNGSEDAVRGLLERLTVLVSRFDERILRMEWLTIDLPRREGRGHEWEVGVSENDDQMKMMHVLHPGDGLEVQDLILKVNGSVRAKEALLDERTLEVIRVVVSDEEGDDATSAPLVVPKSAEEEVLASASSDLEDNSDTVTKGSISASGNQGDARSASDTMPADLASDDEDEVRDDAPPADEGTETGRLAHLQEEEGTPEKEEEVRLAKLEEEEEARRREEEMEAYYERRREEEWAAKAVVDEPQENETISNLGLRELVDIVAGKGQRVEASNEKKEGSGEAKAGNDSALCGNPNQVCLLSPKTLVSCQGKESASAHFSVIIGDETFYFHKRPGLADFLDRMSKKYEIVVYTASERFYADKVLDHIDPRGLISTRLFRESCVLHEGNYVKDLSLLGRPLTQVVFVGNNPKSYQFQPENAIDCSGFIDDVNDYELRQIGDYLTSIGGNEIHDLRGVVTLWREWPYGIIDYAELPTKLARMHHAFLSRSVGMESDMAEYREQKEKVKKVVEKQKRDYDTLAIDNDELNSKIVHQRKWYIGLSVIAFLGGAAMTKFEGTLSNARGRNPNSLAACGRFGESNDSLFGVSLDDSQESSRDDALLMATTPYASFDNQDSSGVRGSIHLEAYVSLSSHKASLAAKDAEKEEALSLRDKDHEKALAAKDAEKEEALSLRDKDHEKALAAKDAEKEEALSLRDEDHEKALAAKDAEKEEAVSLRDKDYEKALAAKDAEKEEVDEKYYLCWNSVKEIKSQLPIYEQKCKEDEHAAYTEGVKVGKSLGSARSIVACSVLKEELATCETNLSNAKTSYASCQSMTSLLFDKCKAKVEEIVKQNEALVATIDANKAKSDKAFKASQIAYTKYLEEGDDEVDEEIDEE